MENSKKFDSFQNESEIKKMCIDIEHELFMKAKNLIMYQSSFLKKINQIKRCTKEQKSFIEEQNQMTANVLENEVQRTPIEDDVILESPHKFSFVGFKNALTMIKKSEITEIKLDEESNDDLAIIEENISKKDQTEATNDSIEEIEYKGPMKKKHKKPVDPICIDYNDEENEFMNSQKEVITFAQTCKSIEKKQNENFKENDTLREQKESYLKLQEISKLVVKELMPHYSNRKIKDKVVFGINFKITN